jgi:SAM-dependent methyltransferase
MPEDLTARGIDWNALWKEDWERHEWQRTSEHWDKRAPSFAKKVSEGDYADQFIELMRPEADWTVLDVGCAAGTIAIPLAKRVRHVTAMDFSPAMIDLLRTACRDNAIENVSAVLGSWGDDWEALGIGTHDVAIASRSMCVKDHRRALEKLNAIARKRVYISAPVGDGPFDRRIFEAIGRELKPRLDYIYTYNILYQMGVCANVAFATMNRDRTYESPEAACESVLWMLPEISEAEEMKLRRFVSEHLTPYGSGLRFNYDRSVRWAVMWWDVGQPRLG